MSSEPRIVPPSITERREARRLLKLFHGRMQPGDATLEMLIYQANPRLGMLVTRQDLYQWFRGRNEISVSKYPSIRAFIETEGFLRIVPEAERFVRGILSETIKCGCMLAKLNGFDLPARDESIFKNMRGLWRGLNGPHPARLFYFELVDGYEFLIVHSRSKERPFNPSSGFIFFANFPNPSSMTRSFHYLSWDRRTRAEERGAGFVAKADASKAHGLDYILISANSISWKLARMADQKEWPEIDSMAFDVLGHWEE